MILWIVQSQSRDSRLVRPKKQAKAIKVEALPNPKFSGIQLGMHTDFSESSTQK